MINIKMLRKKLKKIPALYHAYQRLRQIKRLIITPVLSPLSHLYKAIRKTLSDHLSNLSQKFKQASRDYLQGAQGLEKAHTLMQHQDLSACIDFLKRKYKFYKPPSIKFILSACQYYQALEKKQSLPTEATNKRPHIIHFCVWGESYISKFIHYVLPSLLATKNLPTISQQVAVTLLIHCDYTSKQKIEQSAVIQKINNYARLQYKCMPTRLISHYHHSLKTKIVKPHHLAHHLKYMLLGILQTDALATALQAKAYISFLMPDIILSESFFSDSFAKIADKKSVLTLSNCINFQTVSKHLDQYYDDSKQLTLSIPNAILAGLQVDHLHPTEYRLIVSEQTEHFLTSARLLFKSKDGLVIRSFHYHPVLLDCGKINRSIQFDFKPIDNTSLFDLLDENIPYAQQIWVCENTAHLAMMALADEDMPPAPLYGKKHYTYLELVDLVKHMLKSNTSMYDNPLNQYLVSLRHQYFSITPTTQHLTIDDQTFIEDLYK